MRSDNLSVSQERHLTSANDTRFSMLSQNPRFAHSNFKKTDLFSPEAKKETPRTVVDRNRSNIFAGVAAAPASAKTDRMASDIFFNKTALGEYTPSGPADARRTFTQDPTFFQESRANSRTNSFSQEDNVMRGSRRHYLVDRNSSSIDFNAQSPKRSNPSSADSSSFDNIFGSSQSSFEGYAAEPPTTFGLSSNDLNRERRGKGRRNAHPMSSQIWF